jgi:hypothetical protein
MMCRGSPSNSLLTKTPTKRPSNRASMKSPPSIGAAVNWGPPVFFFVGMAYGWEMSSTRAPVSSSSALRAMSA